MSRARLILLNAALGPLDYRVPQGMAVEPGSIVVAPLGPRQLVGVVWEPERLPTEEVGDNRLRPLLHAYDLPPLGAPLRRLIEWTADYYLAPLASVLRMALPSSGALDGARSITEYRATGHVPERLTPQRAQALERIGDRLGLIRELAIVGGVSDGVIRGLVKAGAIEPVEIAIDDPFPAPAPDHDPPVLEPAQGAAAAELRAAVDAGAFAPYLLDGVTGSGKTEVYFEAIAEAVRAGKQALVLLPEIALTEPFLKRFAARFGCDPVPWHSGLRQSQRRRAWRAIAGGEARVVVGARSALFLPYPKLGLIVVDEAHEASFKQEDGVQYHARDVAVMRAKFEEIPVILASATPAIESRHMAEIGTYKELLLPDRFGGARLPDMAALDMLQDPPPRGRWLAPALVRALEENLEAGEQSLLFLNRRGYAPLTLCRHCGYRFQCPNCTAWMVEHRFTRRLACHHCGHVMPAPHACPECKEEDSLVACGPGVERIADEIHALLPAARTIIVTSDTMTGLRRPPDGAMGAPSWSPAKAAEFVARMEAGEIDIVIGTQLGHQGLSLPQSDPGRRGRCRSGPCRRRPARRRAQLPADPPGLRPRRPRRQARPRPRPDPRPQGAGHPGSGQRRCRGLLRRRNRRPPRGRHAALRPPRRDRRLVGGSGPGQRDRPDDRPRRPGPREYGGVRPRSPPRSPCCAAATASASSSTPRGRFRCRTSSGSGWGRSSGRAASG